MSICILIPLLVGLISAILGYLLGRYLMRDWKDKAERFEADYNECKKSKLDLTSNLKAATSKNKVSFSDDSKHKARISSLEADLSSEKLKNMALNNEVSLLSKKGNSNLGFVAGASLLAFDAAAAKSIFGKNIKQDDLTIVEGIGPKIQELFHNHDVKTWEALSKCSFEKCTEVLESGGSRFKMHNPKTWPKQAGFAVEGKWAALKKWQDELDGGN